MRGSEHMVQLEGFAKRYGKLQAVWPLDLEIATGESFALLGPNGGGKTSVLRALVGLHAPSAGRILLGGIDIARDPDRAKSLFSYVPQRVGLPEMLTPREVVRLFARLKGVASQRGERALERFGLEPSADRPTGDLSGGMQQRLGLAVGFLAEVPLLVLDEPTVNLDPPGVEQLHELLAELKSKGTTIVFSSHLVRSAVSLADRVGVLVEGRLVPPEDVPAFQAAVHRQTPVKVVLSHITDAMISAVRDAGGHVSGHEGNAVSFTALPERRLQVIRAIEQSGGTVEEFHTDAPDWEALIRERASRQ